MSIKSHNSDIQILFKQAFIENFPKVKYYALSYLNDEHLAENVAQDAFLQLWINKEKVDFNKSVLPYLLRLVKNNSLNILRKDKYGKAYSEYLNYIALNDRTSHTLYTNELIDLFDKSLLDMNKEVRETFILCKEEDYTYNKAAQELGVSPKTVEKRVSKALKILRESLKDYLGFIFIFGRVIM